MKKINMIIVSGMIIAIIASLTVNVVAVTPNISLRDINSSNNTGIINYTLVNKSYVGSTFISTNNLNLTSKPNNIQTIDTIKGINNPIKISTDNREDVIVYFKQTPSSLQDFASEYGVKLIFVKPDIGMAAFETSTIRQPNTTSSIAQSFITAVSKDSRVESAELDGAVFVNSSENYTSQPIIHTPADYQRTNTNYVQNKVDIGFWKLPQSLSEFGDKYGATLINSSVDSELKFATFSTNDMTGFINNVSTDPYVRSASPVEIGHVSGYTTNDPWFANQWYLNDINVTDAWYYQTGSTNIKIAIIDSGVDYNHVDLSGRVIKGYNFIAGNYNPMDDLGHGTEMAGIAASISNNGAAIAGISQSQILAIKAVDSQGNIDSGTAAQAIIWADNNASNIISMSFGFSQPDSRLQSACQQAYNDGRILIGASGNNGANTIDYPAAYSPYVLAIGGIDQTDNRASFSNYGSQLFLVAPAVNITSDYPGNQVAYGLSGTSCAVPEVAGVAALILSENPGFSNNEVAAYLAKSAVPLGGSVPNQYYGYGKLQGFGATMFGQILNQFGDNLPSGYIEQIAMNVTDYQYIHTVMAANYNSQWVLLEKWGSPATPVNYDAVSYYTGGMQDILVHGSGTLYTTAWAYSGGGKL